MVCGSGGESCVQELVIQDPDLEVVVHRLRYGDAKLYCC